jgi:GMP synthase-like glutamine amidotransferase
MAEAFGGEVRKSDRGWGVGLQTYKVSGPERWMQDSAPFRVPVSHQDQVVTVPPAGRVVGGNQFSPNGMLAYQDQPALSFQCHPEFDPGFARALIESRRDHLPDSDAALASLAQADDRPRVAAWLRAFLQTGTAARADGQ